jgi:hypothetical protein
VIPCEHDTASNMLAFGRRLFDARRLSNVDREFAFGPIGSISLVP